MRMCRARSQSRIAFHVAVLIANASCSPSPEQKGPLASLAKATLQGATLTCNGTRPAHCFGYLGDTIAFFETNSVGTVKLVARQWEVRPSGTAASVAQLTTQLSADWGVGMPCSSESGHGNVKERLWTNGTTSVSLVSWTPSPGDTGTPVMSITWRLGQARCGESAQAPLRM